MSRFGQQARQRTTTRKSYTTQFSASENPILENGVWTTGSSFSPIVQTSGGVAFGNQTGDEKFVPNYNDSHAFLAGFPPSHRVETTLHFPGSAIAGDLEVECMLGCKFGPVRNVGTNPGDAFNNQTDFDGIEVNITVGKYGNLGFVARFLDGTGVVDEFSSALQAHGIHDLDRFCAELRVNHTDATGTVIVSMIRATTNVETPLIVTAARSNYYRIGNPGIGFYRENNSPGVTDDPTLFSLTAFTAIALE